ncbi:alpha/beta hydrolase [Chitinophagaceae bacterium MMS25-I14]
MKQLSILLVPIILLCGCIRKPVRSSGSGADAASAGIKRVYSTNVKDSFSIFIDLPDGYDTAKARYPVVYLLDANFYFDMIVPIVHKYAALGGVQPAILVGVGYRDFQQMDSLRDRDYTYPQEREMKNSGGGEKFVAFLQEELLPQIDAQYRSDTAHRVLMGHSLGGYSTLYTLFHNLQQGKTPFKYYVAASPSLDYHHEYLLSEWQKQHHNDSTVRVFATFGGLEDEENKDDVPSSPKVATLLSGLQQLLEKDSIKYKSEIYSSLGHMDAALPAFSKGLQWSLEEK